jgi:CRP/FNR family transcriptional regulator
VAIDDALAWLWPRQRLIDLIRSAPELALSLVLSVSVWTRHLVTKLELLTQRRVEERLAIYLAARAGEHGIADGIDLTLAETRQLIAAQLGTGPEVLSRTFRRLEDDGIIAVDGLEVRVLDARRLAVLAEPLGS